MEKLHFSISINAPKEKVWDVMLNDVTYRQWTSVFNPSGSYYEGDWNTGSSIRFLGPNPDGTVSGMLSRIKENRQYEFISIQHLGEILNGQEKIWSEEVTKGNEFCENYTLKQTGEVTEVTVDLDSNEEWKKMFEEMWPKALEKVKTLAEAL
jgi:uncharacterized protein YndB with AHSA1/START domain